MLLVIGVTGHTGKYFLQELMKNKYKEKIRFLIRKENEEQILKDTYLNYETFYGDLEDVESLKKEGAFDADAQKIAFTKTYTNVMKILSDEAKEYLTEALGDLEAYIYNRIEANVKLTK